MLKRHRPASPVPASSSNVHLIPTVDVEAPDFGRFAKRRRTQEAMPDGTVMDSNEVVNDEEEENRSGHAAPKMTTTTTTSEYKSANMMLRELHILNQHRLTFSAPTGPAPATPPPPNSFSMTRVPSLTRHLSYALPQLPSKLHPTPQPDQLPRTFASINKFIEGPMEEPGVSEKYENINKLLGSVVLSRRRVLDSSSHNMPHS